MQLFNCFVTVNSLYIANIDTYCSLSLADIFENNSLMSIDIQSMLLDYNKDTVTFNISFEKIEDRDLFIKTISSILDNNDYKYSYGIGELKHA